MSYYRILVGEKAGEVAESFYDVAVTAGHWRNHVYFAGLPPDPEEALEIIHSAIPDWSAGTILLAATLQDLEKCPDRIVGLAHRIAGVITIQEHESIGNETRHWLLGINEATKPLDEEEDEEARP